MHREHTWCIGCCVRGAVCVELLALVATVLLSVVGAFILIELYLVFQNALVVSILLVAAFIHGLGHAAWCLKEGSHTYKATQSMA